jgi:hypothetical protein
MARFGQMTKDHMAKGQISRSPTTQGCHHLARIFHELLSRDHEDGRATWQPQGVGSEAYLNGTSQGPTPEDARLPARRAYSSERRTAISVVAASDS